MPAGKPLSYLSLRCILNYMEANKRFNIARCCPSIEKLEKKIPLKIQKLVFGSKDFSINSVHYEVSLICEALGEGVESKYGFESDENNKLVNYDDSFLNSIEPGTSISYRLDNFYSKEEVAENARREALRKVKNHGPRVKFSHHIFMENWSNAIEIEKRIERVAHNKTLTEAREYLANKFLSGRIVYVDSLLIMDDEECMPPIPSKAKLTVAHLRKIKNADWSFDAIRSILDGTPLESVCLETPERFDDPIVSTAKKVIVTGCSSLLEIGSRIPRVDVVGMNYRDDLGNLLNHFITQGRPAGTFYSVQTYWLWNQESLFEKIRNARGAKIIELEEAGKYSGYAIIPLIGGCELHVRCVPFEGDGWGDVANVTFQFYPKGYSGLNFSS